MKPLLLTALLLALLARSATEIVANDKDESFTGKSLKWP